MVLLIECHSGDQITADEMDGTCSTLGERQFMQNLVEKRKERDQLEDVFVDERIILKWILKK